MKQFIPLYSLKICLIFIWLIPSQVFSQTEIGFKSNTYKTNLQQKLILRMDLVNDINKVEINTKDGQHLKLSPNEAVKLNLNAQYDFLSFSYAYTPTFLPGNSDDHLKGSTTTKDFALNIFINRLFGEINLNKTSGYYLENTKKLFPEFEEPFMIFDSFERKFIYFELGYNFNRNFSFKSFLVFNEVQEKSAGSFIPRIIYSSSKYSLNQFNIHQERKNDRLSITGNYIHTFVIRKHFRITTGLGFGFGMSDIEDIDFKAEVPVKNYKNTVGNAEVVFQFSYQKENLFMGFSSFSRGTTELKKEVENAFRDQSITAAFFIGYRFGAPKILEKSFKTFKGWFKKKKDS